VGARVFRDKAHDILDIKLSSLMAIRNQDAHTFCGGHSKLLAIFLYYKLDICISRFAQFQISCASTLAISDKHNN
jgi:hypothetical protein